MTSARTNLVMTVIGFVVSTLFIVFICTRLICARIQLRRRHISSRSNLTTLDRGLHDAEPPLPSNFPAKKYGDDYFSSAESGQVKYVIEHKTARCSICLAEYHKEDVLRILPYCGHYFHIKCIDIWLLQHCTCPVCRISLRETNEKKRSMQLLSSSRSHLGSDFPAISPRHCRFISRTPETRSRNSVQEDQLSSRVGIEVARDITQSTVENGIGKDPGNKHVESPSA